MEERLLAADFGVANSERIVATMRDRWRLGKIKNADSLKAIFPTINKECLGCHETYRIKDG